MTTILGAGGPISNELAKALAARQLPFRLVGRNPRPVPGVTELVSADILNQDQVIQALAGSSVVHLLVGFKYDHKLWADQWPRAMANTIEACKRAAAKLVFFDNVYMYGKVNGPMTEDTPFNPCSKKGEIRAQIATTLINEWQAGRLTALIARSADFYGPNATNSAIHSLIFEPLSKNKKASALVNESMPHSLTFTPDAGRSLLTLAESPSAWNQTWHVPTAPNPLTTKQFIAAAAQEFNGSAKHRTLSKPILTAVGWFNPLVRELGEMFYQNDSPYLFNSSKFANAFGFSGTPYPEGIRLTASSYK